MTEDRTVGTAPMTSYVKVGPVVFGVEKTYRQGNAEFIAFTVWVANKPDDPESLEVYFYPHSGAFIMQTQRRPEGVITSPWHLAALVESMNLDLALYGGDPNADQVKKMFPKAAWEVMGTSFVQSMMPPEHPVCPAKYSHGPNVLSVRCVLPEGHQGQHDWPGFDQHTPIEFPDPDGVFGTPFSVISKDEVHQMDLIAEGKVVIARDGQNWLVKSRDIIGKTGERPDLRPGAELVLIVDDNEPDLAAAAQAEERLAQGPQPS